MLSKLEYTSLSNFRHQLARFLRFSENAARSAGITPKQYLLLLHIRGCDGRNWSSVGELAHRLQSSPHGTVALVNRCVTRKLVTKRSSAKDARSVEVHLTARGKDLVAKIAGRHRAEIRSMKSVFQVANVS
jgi:DNA-binding MarR family transcriptional regulator